MRIKTMMVMWLSCLLSITACESVMDGPKPVATASVGDEMSLDWPHQSVPKNLTKAVPNLMISLDDETKMRVTMGYISALGLHCKKYQIIEQVEEGEGADILQEHLACKDNELWQPIRIYKHKV